MKLTCGHLQEARQIGYGRMHGIPLVASSPVRNDSPLNVYGFDVTSYQPPWKSISEMAMYSDMENQAGFPIHSQEQDLMNQVRCHLKNTGRMQLNIN